MKKLVMIIALLAMLSFQLFAQHALIGTWENINNSVKSIKIITPTHFMVFAESQNENGSEFMRSHGGTYTLNGNKFVEKINVASWEDYGKEKTDFTVESNENTFYQKGILILGDGSEVMVDEVWKKVLTNDSYIKNPSIGVWDQLNSTYTLADGTKESHTNDTATRFQIITPTHWMRISHRDGKFENCMGGTYKWDGKKMYPNFEYSSFPDDEFIEVAIDQKVKRNKMYWNGTGISKKDNSPLNFADEFQLIDSKVSKQAVVR